MNSTYIGKRTGTGLGMMEEDKDAKELSTAGRFVEMTRGSSTDRGGPERTGGWDSTVRRDEEDG